MLKKIFIVSAIVAMAVSCTEKTDKYQITWEKVKIPVSQYAIKGDSISVSYPVAAKGEKAEIINGHIQDVLAGFIGYPGKSIPVAVDSLLLKRNNDTSVVSTFPYSIITDGEGMNFGNVASAKLSVYQLTGGANGLASEIYINFDKRTGGKLSLANMIADTAALRTANIEAFRKVRGNETGDMFMALKDLPLPEYAGISAEGLHVHYNPYEVASNAFGSTDYTIPAATIRPMLNKDLFPGR